MSTGGYVGVNSTIYTPVEYIQSSGTQYVDTGFQPNQDTGFEIDFTPLSPIATSGYGYILGAADSSKRFSMNTYPYVSGAGGELYVTSGFDAYMTQNTRKQTTYKNKVFLDNDGHTYTVSVSAFSVSKNFFIFTSSNASGANTSMASMKLYSFKLYDGNTLIRDYIPVLDNNNVACLFDKVEERFIYNQGTGVFTYGAAGTPLVGDVARKLRKGYVGVSGTARKLIKGYVGVNGTARICYDGKIPTLRTYIEDSVHISNPSVTNTTDYILIGGGTTSGSTRIKTVTAYPSTLVAVSAPDLTTQAWQMGSCSFNGYGIFAGGMTGSNGSSRTNQCLAYDNSLTKTTLPTLNAAVYDLASASNSVHFIMAGGTNYSSRQTTVVSYSTNFTKSTLTNMSGKRSQNAAAAVGEYLVCCGIWDGYGPTDFYDNSNVRTTGTDAYGKATDNVLGLSTTDYAVFWGGATAYNSGQYKDCRAYDKNKVLYKFDLPNAYWKMQGVYNGSYVWLCNKKESFIYTNDLVLAYTNTETENIYGEGQYIQAATTKGIAIHHKQGTSRLNIIDV